MLGARRLLARLMLAPLIGALILWLSDQLILWLTRVWMEVSTGSVTALIGAPLLLWLLPRLRSISARQWMPAIKYMLSVSRWCGSALPDWRCWLSPRLPHSRWDATPRAGTGRRGFAA